MREHVIFSHEPDSEPAWTYRSHPIACLGMADTLGQAREDFRQALAFALEDGETEPEVVEHLERRHPDDFWVRIRLGPDAKERDYAALVFLGTWTHVPNRAEGPPPLIARTNTDIGEPVVIACLPGNTIGSVVEQFKDGESYAVLLSFVDVQEGYDWTWVCGIARGANSAKDHPAASLADRGLTLDSTMLDLMNASIAGGRESEPQPLLVVA